MAINFSAINLEVVDLNANASPDIFLNQGSVTFSKRVLEVLGYPQYVQFCMDAANKVFAIRICKGTEAKATLFSKPKNEQTATLAFPNKNLCDVMGAMIPDYVKKNRYRISGEYNTENRVMYFDMSSAAKSNYHKTAE